MLDRMVKSARFSHDTFLALKEDPTATGQALIVLALAGASFGVGFAASIGFSRIGISTVIAVKTALGLDTQRSLVIFIIVTFIVLLGYGFVASLLSAIKKSLTATRGEAYCSAVGVFATAGLYLLKISIAGSFFMS